MSFWAWLVATVVTPIVGAIVRSICNSIDKSTNEIDNAGGYDEKNGNLDQNTKWIGIVDKNCQSMKSEMKQNLNTFIENDKNFFNGLFKKMKGTFENIDTSYLETILDETMASNQEEMEALIQENLTVDNDELQKIAKMESQHERSKLFQNFKKTLFDKIVNCFSKSRKKLFDEVLRACKEELNSNIKNIKKSINDISRMINDNSDDQCEVEDILIDNIQKKIICQMAIDAVESVN